MIKDVKDVDYFVYDSYMKALPFINKYDLDAKVRTPELTRTILDEIGSPDADQVNILVTGSKGKGSVSRILSKVLQSLGYRVGLFSSPHLLSFSERIRVDGRAIDDESLVNVARSIYHTVKGIDGDLPRGRYIGPVGISVIMAQIFFREQETDINVIECGRGGLYDDCNMINHTYALITPVYFEHPHQLGPTMEDIARNKAGIITGQVTNVYTARQEKVVEEIITDTAAGCGALVKVYGRDFWAQDILTDVLGTRFSVCTHKNRYDGLRLPLLGEHQAENTALALAAAEDVAGNLNLHNIRQGLKSANWPGRMEIVKKKPLTIIDGAINEQGAVYLKNILKRIGNKPVVCIIGVPADKDYKGVIRTLSKVSDYCIITRALNDHLDFPGDALSYAQTCCENSRETKNLWEGMEEAKVYMGNREGIICIVGTQSLVADGLRYHGMDIKNLL
ncbi:MAG: bifunctional folylpolyglutamate synthase/dihydrofolate synthase [Mahellales bacterium]|jgi:dihydrofolate synthase/folylpolyglutamate synthase